MAIIAVILLILLQETSAQATNNRTSSLISTTLTPIQTSSSATGKTSIEKETSQTPSSNAAATPGPMLSVSRDNNPSKATPLTTKTEKKSTSSSATITTGPIHKDSDNNETASRSLQFDSRPAKESTTTIITTSAGPGSDNSNPSNEPPLVTIGKKGNIINGPVQNVSSTTASQPTQDLSNSKTPTNTTTETILPTHGKKENITNGPMQNVSSPTASQPTQDLSNSKTPTNTTTETILPTHGKNKETSTSSYTATAARPMTVTSVTTEVPTHGQKENISAPGYTTDSTASPGQNASLPQNGNFSTTNVTRKKADAPDTGKNTNATSTSNGGKKPDAWILPTLLGLAGAAIVALIIHSWWEDRAKNAGPRQSVRERLRGAVCWTGLQRSSPAAGEDDNAKFELTEV